MQLLRWCSRHCENWYCNRNWVVLQTILQALSNTTVNAADLQTKGRAATEEQLKQ